jgi:hypothetical protein
MTMMMTKKRKKGKGMLPPQRLIEIEELQLRLQFSRDENVKGDDTNKKPNKRGKESYLKGRGAVVLRLELWHWKQKFVQTWWPSREIFSKASSVLVLQITLIFKKRREEKQITTVHIP